MDSNHAMGKRGESIFMTLIMNFCGKPHPYFNPTYLGEKFESLDFMVEALGIPSTRPIFFVQVKATTLGYTGSGKTKRLRVRVAGETIQNILKYPVPAYLVGVDEPNLRGFIVSIHGGMTGGVSSISTASPLSRLFLKRLWEEVRDTWQGRDVKVPQSSFLN